MSWQALNWAAEQNTGSPHSKLLLLLLANRADENGICWPLQISLADQAEQSDDTVQRHLKSMEGRFIARARTKRTKGRWPGYVYQLLMPHIPIADSVDLQEQPARKRVAREAIRRAKSEPVPRVYQIGEGGAQLDTPPSQKETTPRPAVRSEPLPAVSPGRSQRCHRAAQSGVEPSIEPSGERSSHEPSRATAAVTPGPRPRALQGYRSARLDLIHNEIAERLGASGWSILQRLSPDQLAQIEGLQRRGQLTERALHELRTEAALDAARCFDKVSSNAV
jgi:hypothetical protein